MEGCSMSQDDTRNLTSWCLEGCAEQGKRWMIRLHPLPFLIGRHPACNLCLSLTEISRKHALIFERDGQLVVKEFGSANGTFLNRERIVREQPLHDGDVLHFSSLEFRVACKPTFEQLTAQFDTDGTICKSSIKLSQEFNKNEADFLAMLRLSAVTVHFQPIFTLKDQRLIAYELLGRGSHANLSTSPLPLLSIARSLGKEIELSELFRNVGIKRALAMGNHPIFFNILPVEMNFAFLRQSLLRLRKIAPHLPLAIEVHEAAATDPAMMRELRILLNEMDMQLLYDDFGAGQARLVEIIKVPPDILKFGICLIKGVHLLPRREIRAIQTLLHMAQDLGIKVLAEGIEVREEMEVCVELGFDLAQGYYLGRPVLDFTE